MDIVKACSKHVDNCVSISQSHDIAHKDMDHISKLSTSPFGTISYIYSKKYICCWLFLIQHNQFNYIFDGYPHAWIYKISCFFIVSSYVIMHKMLLPFWYYPNDFYA